MIVVLIVTAACAADGSNQQSIASRDSKGKSMSTPDLEIVVDAKHLMGMGYGRVWKAAVQKVVIGELADPHVSLRVFDNASGEHYNGRFRTLEDQHGVTLTLRRVPQQPDVLIGFVAEDGTAWVLVNAR